MIGSLTFALIAGANLFIALQWTFSGKTDWQPALSFSLALVLSLGSIRASLEEAK